MPRRSGYPQGSGEVLERDRGSKSPVSFQPPPRGANKIYRSDEVFRIGEASTKPISPTQLPYRQGKSKNPEKTCKKGLTSGEECGILSELQESGTARSAKAGRTKKLEKSLKNLLTNERQSGIINKLRAARQCSEKHSSLKIEQQDSCILITKVQRLRKFF